MEGKFPCEEDKRRDLASVGERTVGIAETPGNIRSSNRRALSSL